MFGFGPSKNHLPAQARLACYCAIAPAHPSPWSGFASVALIGSVRTVFARRGLPFVCKMLISAPHSI
jgi:hypothetical protein